MIKNLAKLKYWEIVTLGLALPVAANILLMIAVRAINGTWPQTNEAGWIAYAVTSAVFAWAIVGVFAEAWFLKWREARHQKLVDQYLDGIANGTGRHRVQEDLDELAVAFGLAPEKGRDRG